jgi:creatinine amidohydrolase
LQRLAAFGVRQAVLFTGHFADEQVAMIAEIADAWHAGGGPMVVIARGVNGNAGAPFAPDHAGVFETTLLAAFHPRMVDMAMLPAANPGEMGEDPFGAQRHDTAHSLHGIFGADPRAFRPEQASPLRLSMAHWLAASVVPIV